MVSALRWSVVLGCGFAGLAACSADGSGGGSPGQGGVGGGAATGGSAGSAATGGGGSAGSGGSAGTAGGGGSAGTAGSAGSAGSAGTAGTAGSGGASDAGSDASGGSAGTDAGADAAGGSAGVDAGDVTPPTVKSIAPAPGSSGVVKLPTISVTFDEAMNPASITAQTSGTACSGSLQVSGDDFATCVAMSAAPASSAGNTVFSVTPAAALASVGAYKVRVTTAAQDAAGNALSANSTTSAAFVVRYHHTITIDGTNDFDANETFATSTGSYTAYAAWDDVRLYLGMKGPDVAAASATKFLVAYVGGTPGTTSGVLYNTQQPTLPFSAKWHVRWKTDNTFTDALTWSGSAWNAAGFGFTGKIFQKNDFVEMAVALSDLGSPTSLKVVLSMLNEQNLSEFSYAGAPASGYSDGYDANYVKAFDFDLTASVTPKASPLAP